MVLPKPYILDKTYLYTDRPAQQVQKRTYRVNGRICFFVWESRLNRWIFLPFDQALSEIEQGILVEQKAKKMAGT